MQSLITIHSENKYVIWILTHYLNILSTFLFLFVMNCMNIYLNFYFLKLLKTQLKNTNQVTKQMSTRKCNLTVKTRGPINYLKMLITMSPQVSMVEVVVK